MIRHGQITSNLFRPHCCKHVGCHGQIAHTHRSTWPSPHKTMVKPGANLRNRHRTRRHSPRPTDCSFRSMESRKAHTPTMAHRLQVYRCVVALPRHFMSAFCKGASAFCKGASAFCKGASVFASCAAHSVWIVCMRLCVRIHTRTPHACLHLHALSARDPYTCILRT
jgi:hypothetical protein